MYGSASTNSFGTHLMPVVRKTMDNELIAPNMSDPHRTPSAAQLLKKATPKAIHP